MPKDPDTQEKTIAPTLHKVTQQDTLYDRKTGKILSVGPEIATTPAVPLQRKMTRQDMKYDPETGRTSPVGPEINVGYRALPKAPNEEDDREKILASIAS